ncbi:MAG TPA: cytochrome d ubiquinol oxidase subunit II, partial [Candidatus Polarisedimenticolia bacterium]|nr:cytochrome d ubiquinol oxidase subunit II [Candidatus Polarisedimenticolia bacterium]
MALSSCWFALVAAMLAVYVVLDGFDLGTGVIHLCVARSEAERRQVLASIGPVWDGNEAWLIAAAGTLYFAFPTLYASSFSGFYLPLMIVLWLLVLRGAAIELRNHVDSPAWKPLWDVLFCGSSLLLAIVFGAALGNVVRGVPLDAGGFFFLPLWTDDLRPGPRGGIVDWYTLLAGLTALAALTQHGAAWVALKTTGAVRGRAVGLARSAWWATLASTVLLTAATFRVQPHI